MFEWYIYTSLHRNKLHTHENIPSSSTKSLVQHKHILYSLSNYILMYPMGIKCLQPKQLETRMLSKIIKDTYPFLQKWQSPLNYYPRYLSNCDYLPS